MNISFVGLGIMGEKMALNLIKSGHNLTIQNRTKSKADELLKKGAVWVDNLPDVAKEADVLFTMLSTPEVVEDAAFGEKGFVAAMKDGSIWIDCTTVNPSFTNYCKERVSLDSSIDFIDAPVAGSKIPASEAMLTFLVGAEKNIFEKVKPLLEFMGKKVVHCGEVGKGTQMKLIVNSLLGVSLAGFIESLALGKALGFDREFLMETLFNTPVVAPVLKGKKEKLLKEDFAEEFPLKWMLKDLHFVSNLSYDNNVFMPIVNTVKEVFNKAKMSGLGDKDLIAVSEVYKKKD